MMFFDRRGGERVLCASSCRSELFASSQNRPRLQGATRTLNLQLSPPVIYIPDLPSWTFHRWTLFSPNRGVSGHKPFCHRIALVDESRQLAKAYLPCCSSWSV